MSRARVRTHTHTARATHTHSARARIHTDARALMSPHPRTHTPTRAHMRDGSAYELGGAPTHALVHAHAFVGLAAIASSRSVPYACAFRTHTTPWHLQSGWIGGYGVGGRTEGETGK